MRGRAGEKGDREGEGQAVEQAGQTGHTVPPALAPRVAPQLAAGQKDRCWMSIIGCSLKIVIFRRF